jgi:hypothetical protein
MRPFGAWRQTFEAARPAIGRLTGNMAPGPDVFSTPGLLSALARAHGEQIGWV